MGNRSVNRISSVHELSNFGPDLPPKGASIVPGDTVTAGITADSKPDHHGGWLDSGWDCFKWMTWHKRLVEKHGQEKANEQFMAEWDKQSTWDTQMNWCKYDSDWQKYFEAQGLRSHWLARLLASAGQTAASIGDSAEKLAEDGIDDFGDSLSTLLKWLPWIALVAAALIAFFYFKSLTKVVA